MRKIDWNTLRCTRHPILYINESNYTENSSMKTRGKGAPKKKRSADGEFKLGCEYSTVAKNCRIEKDPWQAQEKSSYADTLSHILRYGNI